MGFVGGGGGATGPQGPPGVSSQTPWASDINAAGHALVGFGYVGFQADANLFAHQGAYVYTDDNVLRMAIKQGTGNIGIAQPSPAYKLDVTGDCNVTGQYRVNGTPIAPAPTTQVDVTASRTYGTVYQNTKSVPIFVSVLGFSSAGATLLFKTDAANPPTTAIYADSATSGTTRSACGWVLPGNYYSIGWDGGTQTMQKWIETF